jgi:hypothetical protein
LNRFRLETLLDKLLNQVGDEVYEDEHHRVAEAPAYEVLRFLMEEHRLTS